MPEAALHSDNPIPSSADAAARPDILKVAVVL